MKLGKQSYQLLSWDYVRWADQVLPNKFQMPPAGENTLNLAFLTHVNI